MARDRPPSPRGRRWRGEPSAPSASRQPIFRGAHPERSGRALAFDGRELREHPRRFARRRVALGPASLPRDPRRGARPVRARRRLAVLRGRRTRRAGSAAGARGGRGLIAAEAEIHRLRACVRETEGRLEEERLVFSAVLEEERAALADGANAPRAKPPRAETPREASGRDTHHAGNAVRSRFS